MTMQEQYIERLKELVAVKFGREILSAEDCTAFIEDVRQMVGIIVEEEQIKRLFIIKSRNGANPRPVTLSALARYIGYNSWSDFCSSNEVLPADDVDIIPVTRRWGVIILTAIAIIVVITAIISLLTIDGNPTTTTERQIAIDPQLTIVEAEWVAATTEHCLTLREYQDEANYTKLVAEFIEEYTSTLETEITISLKRYVAEQGIDIDNQSIERAATSIASTCKRMCEGLTREPSHTL